MTTCDLIETTDLPESTVYDDLAALRETSLLTVREEGRERRYRAEPFEIGVITDGQLSGEGHAEGDESDPIPETHERAVSMVELSPTTYIADANLFIRAGTPERQGAKALIVFFRASRGRY